MRMKKEREVSWGFQCLGYHIAPLSYSLPFPSSKHSCFYFATQRIKHIESAAYNHAGILLPAQSSVKVPLLLRKRPQTRIMKTLIHQSRKPPLSIS